MACNSNICFILTSTGSLYMMGNDKNDSRLFGLGKEMIVQAKKPILLDYFSRNNVFITDVAISETVAIAVSGRNFCFL